MPFFKWEGHLISHSEWEATTLFNKDIEGLKRPDVVLPDENILTP